MKMNVNNFSELEENSTYKCNLLWGGLPYGSPRICGFAQNNGLRVPQFNDLICPDSQDDILLSTAQSGGAANVIKYVIKMSDWPSSIMIQLAPRY